jgi:hypothetical protein
MEKIKILREIKDIEPILMDSQSSINLLDEILVARDELFENRLKQGIKNHNKVMSAIRGDLPHQS